MPRRHRAPTFQPTFESPDPTDPTGPIAPHPPASSPRQPPTPPLIIRWSLVRVQAAPLEVPAKRLLSFPNCASHQFAPTSRRSLACRRTVSVTSRSADGRRRKPLPTPRVDEASRSERLSRLAAWFEEPGFDEPTARPFRTLWQTRTEVLAKKSRKALTYILLWLLPRQAPLFGPPVRWWHFGIPRAAVGRCATSSRR